MAIDATVGAMTPSRSPRSRSDEIVAHLSAVHAGRDPVRLALKYQAMDRSFGDFFRGCCSLFYLRAAKLDPPDLPSIWICGDVHLGNFGIYKSQDQKRRFDLNDFDEACVAPALYDLWRLIAALMTTSASPEIGRELAHRALDGYARAIKGRSRAAFDAKDKAKPLPQLFKLSAERKREPWLDERTIVKGATRKFKVDGVKSLACTRSEKAALFELAHQLGKQFHAPTFFEPQDAARRISGLGSLGVPRFILAVAGEGKSDDVRLLDVKAARPPAPAIGLALPVVANANHAWRTLEAQRHLLALPSWPIAAVDVLGDHFTVREIQPCAIRLDPAFQYPSALGTLLGEALARAHLRSARRQGTTHSASLKKKKACDKAAWAAAETLAEETTLDWRAYRAAFKRGAFTVRR
jgi:uncharacterized protein (DUF2252 family)